MKLSSSTVISNGQTHAIIATVILMASVVAYVMPIYGVGQVESDQSIFEKGQKIGIDSRDQRACLPSAKSCMAVLFVGLHACGLLSNSYISKSLPQDSRLKLVICVFCWIGTVGHLANGFI